MLAFYFYDLQYLLFMIPGMILAGLASWRVRSTFSRASRMRASRGWSGREIAQAILDREGIRDVAIEPTQGHLGDHYDPRNKVLRLSPQVYEGRSLAAAGVAAHEVGHAIQHARGYAPLSLRNLIVPIAGFGSNASWIFLIIGMMLNWPNLMIVGCALFTVVVIFQLINLPVEFNASSRARQVLLMNGLVTEVEDKEVGKVLNAAAMTYVAATATAILQLIYFLLRSGLLGGRR